MPDLQWPEQLSGNYRNVLMAGDPLESAMKSLANLTTLGHYRFPLDLLEPHAGAGKIDQRHIGLLKLNIRTGFKADRRYPLTVALKQSPSNMEGKASEDRPFVDSSGAPITAVIIHGLHRVVAMRQLAREGADGTYEQTWYAIIKGPEILSLPHPSSVRQYMRMDNVHLTSCRPSLPERALVLVVETLRAMTYAHTFANGLPLFDEEVLPSVDLFCSVPHAIGVGRWREGLRLMFPDLPLLRSLLKLLSIPGALTAPYLDNVIDNFVFNVGRHSVGCEPQMELLLFLMAKKQSEVNSANQDMYPNGVNMHAIWERSVPIIDTRTFGPVYKALATGEWEALLRDVPLMVHVSLEMHDLRYLPNPFVIDSGCLGEPTEGWVVGTMSKLKAHYRALFFIIMGPGAILRHTDPTDRPVKPADISSKSTARSVLVEWVCNNVPGIARKADAIKVVNTLARHIHTRRNVLMFEDEIWARLSSICDVFEEWGRPRLTERPRLPFLDSQLVSFAALANSMLEHPAWNSLLLGGGSQDDGAIYLLSGTGHFRWAPSATSAAAMKNHVIDDLRVRRPDHDAQGTRLRDQCDNAWRDLELRKLSDSYRQKLEAFDQEEEEPQSECALERQEFLLVVEATEAEAGERAKEAKAKVGGLEHNLADHVRMHRLLPRLEHLYPQLSADQLQRLIASSGIDCPPSAEVLKEPKYYLEYEDLPQTTGSVGDGGSVVNHCKRSQALFPEGDSFSEVPAKKRTRIQSPTASQGEKDNDGEQDDTDSALWATVEDWSGIVFEETSDVQ